MKKFVALILVSAFVFALAGCGTKPETTEPDTSAVTDASETSDFASMANPVTPVESLEALNKELDSKFEQPGVMGVTDEAFSKINCGDYTLGQYDFKVNGNEYCWRFACVAGEDISGIYSGEGTLFPAEPESDFEYAETDEYKAARWFTLDGQYVLSVKDNGQMSKDTFMGIASELKDAAAVGMTENEYIEYYKSLEGEYADETSKRATASVESKGKDGVEIEISWSNSASETVEWEMTAFLGETDGLLSYNDCVKKVETYDENGNETEKIEYENGEGFFTPQDGKLLWNGAADENCTGCVFTFVGVDD